jgi:hypothetical protein
MSVSRGKIHTYLGVTLDYTLQGRVMITMFDYINEIISAYDEADPKGGGTKISAASENLFRIDDDCKKLDDQKSKQFYNLLAKTLCATKRARPDTCTAVAYLTTRVREPDTDDWKKLSHMIMYLRDTKRYHWTQCLRNRHLEVVGRRILCSPSRNARTHRRWPDNGTKIPHCNLHQAETEHTKFHRVGPRFS